MKSRNGITLKPSCKYQPSFGAGLVVFGTGVAFFDGTGLTFVYPMLEGGQHGPDVEAHDFIMGPFPQPLSEHALSPIQATVFA